MGKALLLLLLFNLSAALMIPFPDCDERCLQPCTCNAPCGQNVNCCEDIRRNCKARAMQGTCAGNCGLPFNTSLVCQCDEYCEDHRNCCHDYAEICLHAKQGSCAGICGFPLDSSLSCQCHKYCSVFGNCCHDYAEICLNGQVPQIMAEPEITETSSYDMN